MSRALDPAELDGESVMLACPECRFTYYGGPEHIGEPCNGCGTPMKPKPRGIWCKDCREEWSHGLKSVYPCLESCLIGIAPKLADDPEALAKGNVLEVVHHDECWRVPSAWLARHGRHELSAVEGS